MARKKNPNPIVQILELPSKLMNPSKLLKNPPTGLVVGGIVGGLALAGLMVYSMDARAATPTACAPYKWNEGKVREAIEVRLDTGLRDPARIAVEVCTEVFGTYPGTGATVMFPPRSDSPKGVACVWDRTITLMGKIYDERGIDPDEGLEPDGGPIDIVPVNPMDDINNYPWNTPGQDRANYPTPGLFADVGGPQVHDYSAGLSSVAKAALNSAMAMAAALGHNVSYGQTIMKANEAAGSGPGAVKRNLMKAMRELMEKSQFNWKTYGTNGTGFNVLSYLPRHNNNLARMKEGLTPKRGIRFDGAHISGQGTRQPQFWIPGINLQMLAGQNPVVTVAGMTYNDGSSTLEPPPSVQRLGVDTSGVSVPPTPGQ